VASIAGKALAKHIQEGDLNDGFTLRDVYRKHWAGLSEKQALEQAIDLLLSLGWLKEVVEDTGGKPKVRHRINPKLFVKTGQEASAISAKRGVEGAFGTNGTDPAARFQEPCGSPGHGTFKGVAGGSVGQNDITQGSFLDSLGISGAEDNIWRSAETGRRKP